MTNLPFVKGSGAVVGSGVVSDWAGGKVNEISTVESAGSVAVGLGIPSVAASIER